MKHSLALLSVLLLAPLAVLSVADAPASRLNVVGETGIVSSPEVAQPVAVRYAWKDWPEYSLADGADLPASPFRTDSWK